MQRGGTIGKKRTRAASVGSMAARKKTKAMTTRRPYASVGRSLTICPDRMFVKLPYTVTVLTSSAAVPFINYVYRGNSVYDPEVALFGRSAMGHNVWRQFYGKYRVYGSNCRLRMTSFSNTSTGIVSFGIFPSTTDTAVASAEAANQQPYGRDALIGGQFSTNPMMLYNNITTEKIYGITGIKYQDEYASVVGNNPDNQWYWHVFIEALDGTTAPTNIRFELEITYDVEYYTRVQLESDE